MKFTNISLDSKGSKDELEDEKTEETFSEDDTQIQWLSFNEDEKTWRRIAQYALLWNTRKHKGIVKIVLEDGVNYKVVVKSADELNAVANLFRTEKHVYFNILTRSIASGWKSIGEGTPHPESAVGS